VDFSFILYLLASISLLFFLLAFFAELSPRCTVLLSLLRLFIIIYLSIQPNLIPYFIVRFIIVSFLVLKFTFSLVFYKNLTVPILFLLFSFYILTGLIQDYIDWNLLLNSAVDFNDSALITVAHLIVNGREPIKRLTSRASVSSINCNPSSTKDISLAVTRYFTTYFNSVSSGLMCEYLVKLESPSFLSVKSLSRPVVPNLSALSDRRLSLLVGKFNQCFIKRVLMDIDLAGCQEGIKNFLIPIITVDQFKTILPSIELRLESYITNHPYFYGNLYLI